MTWALAFSKDHNADIFRSDILASYKGEKKNNAMDSNSALQYIYYNPIFDTQENLKENDLLFTSALYIAGSNLEQCIFVCTVYSSG